MFAMYTANWLIILIISLSGSALAEATWPDEKDELKNLISMGEIKYGVKQFNAARDIFERAIKIAPKNEEAQDLLALTKKQLRHLAQQAASTAVIMETLGHAEAAKQYWNQASGYVKPGDQDYEAISKRTWRKPAGEKQNVQVNPMGKLDFIVSDNAIVYMDGEKIGRASANAGFTVEVSAGKKHEFRFLDEKTGKEYLGTYSGKDGIRTKIPIRLGIPR